MELAALQSFHPIDSAKLGSGLIQCRHLGLYGARTAETSASLWHLEFIIIIITRSLHLSGESRNVKQGAKMKDVERS